MFKVNLNPLRRSFLNFAKSCTVSCLSQFDNQNWGSPSSFLKAKIKGVLAGHIVALVTYCATKLTTTYSVLIEQIVDTMSLASTNVEWTLQNLCLGKCWKLFQATLSNKGVNREHKMIATPSFKSLPNFCGLPKFCQPWRLPNLAKQTISDWIKSPGVLISIQSQCTL